MTRTLNFVVFLLARGIPRRPLAARLAVRDLDRSRARIVPAVAAVLTAATLATTLAVLNAGMRTDERGQGTWQMLPTHVTLRTFADYRDPDAAEDAVVASIDGVIPVTGSLRMTSVGGFLDVRDEHRCPGPRAAASGDVRCAVQGGGYPSMFVGDAEELALLLNRTPAPDELADLRAGMILTTHRGYVSNGRATALSQTETMRSEEVPARLVDADAPDGWSEISAGWSIVSADRATKLGWQPKGEAMVVPLARTASEAELDRIEANLNEMALQPVLPRDPHRPGPPLGWFAVGAAGFLLLAIVGLVTALGVTDARRDDATLAAVGAPPGLRRTTTAAQVLVVAGVGTLLGAGIGLLGMTALAHAMPANLIPFAVPGWELVALVFGIPLLGASLTWLVVPASRADAARLLT
ncbi:MAG: hypothetical protein QM708_02100 [Propioniciclava sp.]|uniref:hypothetical protein n=1 Tax=Propioniciclava sp. TaxID=2038686 RepID=UPI0039E27687